MSTTDPGSARNDVAASEGVFDVDEVEGLTPDDYQTRRDTDARVTIAKTLVVSYLILLGVQVVAPFLIVRFSPSPDEQLLNAIETLTRPVAAAITSLTGILGFVLGYYFKSQESRSS